MSRLLFLLIKDRDNTKSPAVRRAYGTLSSLVGIVLNLLLSAIKLLAGAISGSVSITADAVNNLSDAGSQLIALISFKMAAKPADRDHPFGHARIEYVASMIVSFLIMHVSIDLFSDSVDKILHPEENNFTPVTLVILSVSILLKLWLAIFNRRVAKKIDSSVIKATAADSLSDAIATTAVLVSAIISIFTDLNTDAYMGIIVSALIFIAGIKILNETKNSILGGAPDPETVEAIKTTALSYPEFLGIHDLIVHNYGPGNTIASFHVEVNGNDNVFVIHDAVDRLEYQLFRELGVRTTVHMDPIVTDDEKVSALREKVDRIVHTIDPSISMHDFRFVEGVTHSNLIFDIAVPFELPIKEKELVERISAAVKEIDPSFETVVTVDKE